VYIRGKNKIIEDKTKQHIFFLCNELWKSGYMEESFVACNWSYNVSKQYEPLGKACFGSILAQDIITICNRENAL
jgi:hypothetical protein